MSETNNVVASVVKDLHASDHSSRSIIGAIKMALNNDDSQTIFGDRVVNDAIGDAIKLLLDSGIDQQEIDAALTEALTQFDESMVANTNIHGVDLTPHPMAPAHPLGWNK